MTTPKYENLDELREQRRELSERIHEIEREQAAKDAAAFVGRYFKYRNCYSCPSDESDYWCMYTAVVRSDELGDLWGLRFQTDKYGKTEVEEGTVYPSTLGEEITTDEFLAALKALRHWFSAKFDTYA